MSDILNIRVTERELDLIMDLLHEAGLRTDADGQPAIELCHDLMEQSGREVDELEPTDLDGRTFTVAESDFIDHLTDRQNQINWMVKYLKKGGIVAVMLDQATSDGEFFDFLGVPAKTATSIAKIALKLNALVVPSYAVRSRKNHSISIYFEEPIGHTTYQEMTSKLTQSIENRVVTDPEQWYWLHKRWKY